MKFIKFSRKNKNDIEPANFVEVTHTFYPIFTKFFIVFSIILFFVSFFVGLFAFASLSDKAAPTKPPLETFLDILQRLLLFLPALFYAGIFFVSRHLKSNVRALVILGISIVFILAAIVFIYNQSSDKMIALSRIFFLLAFFTFISLLILKNIFDNFYLKVVFWTIIVAAIVIIFSDYGGTILFYVTYLFLTDVFISFALLFVSAGLFIVLFAVLNVNLRLHPLFDFGVFTFISIIVIKAIALNTILHDLCEMIGTSSVDDLLLMYAYFMCCYFVFLLSFVESFLSYNQKMV